MMRASGNLLAVAILVAPVCGVAAEEKGKRDAPIAQSVVKIISSRRHYEPTRPWIRGTAQEVTGSGVVIDGKRILTSAQLVVHSTQVFVQPNQSADKLPATVKSIAPDIDLAVLTVDDDEFFENYPPLARSSVLPSVKDTVHVHGYPVGGDTQSTTKGIVSRIEFAQYYYDTMGLRVQVDAAINPGNSGGPAVVGDQMVGIIFNRLQSADNIGYITPVEEIELFLDDTADGRRDGKASLFDVVQSVENEALRRRLKLPKGVDGVMIWKPDPDGPSNPLKPWDVITKVGDHSLDANGLITAGPDLRLNFRYFVQKLAKNGKINLEVFRDGKTIRLDVPTASSVTRPRLLPFLFEKPPSYVVWGPIIFTNATADYISSFQSKGMAELWFPYFYHNRSPLLSLAGVAPRFEGEQLVVAAELLSHRVSQGYSAPTSSVVDQIDGVKVKNLRHLAELLRDAKGEFVTITFQDRTPDAFVLDRKKVSDAAEEILSENSIRKPYSDDLKDVYEGKK